MAHSLTKSSVQEIHKCTLLCTLPFKTAAESVLLTVWHGSRKHKNTCTHSILTQPLKFCNRHPIPRWHVCFQPLYASDISAIMTVDKVTLADANVNLVSTARKGQNFIMKYSKKRISFSVHHTQGKCVMNTLGALLRTLHSSMSWMWMPCSSDYKTIEKCFELRVAYASLRCSIPSQCRKLPIFHTFD